VELSDIENKNSTTTSKDEWEIMLKTSEGADPI